MKMFKGALPIWVFLLSGFLLVAFVASILYRNEPFQNMSSTYANDSCKGLNSKDTCITQSFCGWCPDQNRCVEVDSAGAPRDRVYLDVPSSSKCNPATFVRSTVTKATTYANDVCKNLSTQQSCVSTSKCGWCPDRKRCVEMDEKRNPRDVAYSDIRASERCNTLLYMRSTAPSEGSSFGRWNVEQTTKQGATGQTVMPQTYSPPAAGACPPMNPATRTSIQSQLNRVPELVKEIDRIKMLGGTLKNYSRTTLQINTATQLNDAAQKLQGSLVDVQQKLSALL